MIFEAYFYFSQQEKGLHAFSIKMGLLPQQNWDKVELKDPDSRSIHEEVGFF